MLGESARISRVPDEAVEARLASRGFGEGPFFADGDLVVAAVQTVSMSLIETNAVLEDDVPHAGC
jgi:hypothetical protein